MMTLWCIFRSPLMLGCELNDMDGWTLSLITNARVLALSERSRNAREMARCGNHILWRSDDRDGTCVYAAMFSTAGWEETHVLSLAELELEGPVQITDLWSGERAGILEDRMTVPMAVHGARLFSLEPV